MMGWLREFASEVQSLHQKRMEQWLEKQREALDSTSTAPELAGPATESSESTDGGDNCNWRDVQNKLERLRLQGERYTSQQKLADKIGCKKFLVQKAIANGPVELQEWASRQRAASRLNAAPEAAAVAFENTPQGREPDPAEMLHDCDVDVVLSKLLDQVSPDERARINGMTPAEKRQLAEITYRDMDAEEQTERHRRAARLRQG